MYKKKKELIQAITEHVASTMQKTQKAKKEDPLWKDWDWIKHTYPALTADNYLEGFIKFMISKPKAGIPEQVFMDVESAVRRDKMLANLVLFFFFFFSCT